MNQKNEIRKWFDKQLRYNCSDNSGDVYTLRSEHYGNRNYVGDFPPYRYVWPLREPYYPDYTYPRTYTYGWETKTYTSDSMNDDIKELKNLINKQDEVLKKVEKNLKDITNYFRYVYIEYKYGDYWMVVGLNGGIKSEDLTKAMKYFNDEVTVNPENGLIMLRYQLVVADE